MVNRLLLFVVAMATVQTSLCQIYDDWIVTAQNIGEDIILNCCRFTNYCQHLTHLRYLHSCQFEMFD